jgi:uncharacterized protein (TIGR00369 family)
MRIKNKEESIKEIVHPNCVACGFANEQGLHLEYTSIREGGVTATFFCRDTLEGYPGILHGGIITMVLDSAMGNCLFARGTSTVTVEMTTKFRHPVLTGREATVSAMLTRVSHPLYLLEAEIVQDGQVKATAKGKFYDQPDLLQVLGDRV